MVDAVSWSKLKVLPVILSLPPPRPSIAAPPTASLNVRVIVVPPCAVTDVGIIISLSEL